MYEARAVGGGVHIYGAGTADPLERLELAARLRRAIERGELELHHQPILRLADAGVIDALGDWVLRDVCRQASEWASLGLRPNVGFNVSPRQLRRPDVAQRFAEV